MQKPSRPETGLSLAEALKKWSLPEQYEAMERLSEFANGYTEATYKHWAEYRRKRDALEKAFVERLKHAEIFCSAVLEGGIDRDILKPAAWAVLGIDYEFDGVSGNNRIYNDAEFFEAHQIPENITEIPEWFALYSAKESETDEFQAYDASCKHVRMRDQDFTLGDKPAAVVRQLWEASRTAEPWVNGKLLIGRAGSRQMKMHDLVRPKERREALMESDGQGAYRLNLTRR